MSDDITDAWRTVRSWNGEEIAKEKHLRDHLTDGHWHDDCVYCHERRLHGGTGLRSRNEGSRNG